MVAILMTSLLGPDAELRWANWFKLLHMTQSLFWYRSPKIVKTFTRDAHSTYWFDTVNNAVTRWMNFRENHCMSMTYNYSTTIFRSIFAQNVQISGRKI